MLHPIIALTAAAGATIAAAVAPCPPDAPGQASAAAVASTGDRVVLTRNLDGRTTADGFVALGSFAGDGADDTPHRVTVDGSSSFTITISDGDDVITITKDDDGLSATQDGQRLPARRIRERDGTIEVLDADGEVAHSVPVMIATRGRDAFTLAFGGDDPRFPQAGNERLLRWAQGPRGLARVQVDGNDDAVRWFDPNTNAEPPAVMLGVHMEAAGDALAAQLGLDAGEVTVVTGVLEGLPAADAGLKPYDVIVAIDGSTPADPATIKSMLAGRSDGDRITFAVIRRAQRRSVTVDLQAWDGERLSAANVVGRAAVADRADNNFFRFDGDGEFPIALAPLQRDGAAAGVQDFAILRRPNAGEWNFEVPGVRGNVQLDMETIGELRGLRDDIVRDVQVELRRELPRLMIELNRGVREGRPMVQELRRLAPNVQAEVRRVLPDVHERLMLIEPQLAPILEQLHELEGIEGLENIDTSRILGTIIGRMRGMGVDGEAMDVIIGLHEDGEHEHAGLRGREGMHEHDGDAGHAEAHDEHAGHDRDEADDQIRWVELEERVIEGGRLGALEARMERIERMLERLVAGQRRGPGRE